MLDQTEFNLLSNVDKWREYRDASEMAHRGRMFADRTECDKLCDELIAAKRVIESARKCMDWQTGGKRHPYENRMADAQAYHDALKAYDEVAE